MYYVFKIRLKYGETSEFISTDYFCDTKKEVDDFEKAAKEFINTSFDKIPDYIDFYQLKAPKLKVKDVNKSIFINRIEEKKLRSPE